MGTCGVIKIEKPHIGPCAGRCAGNRSLNPRIRLPLRRVELRPAFTRAGSHWVAGQMTDVTPWRGPFESYLLAHLL